MTFFRYVAQLEHIECEKIFWARQIERVLKAEQTDLFMSSASYSVVYKFLNIFHLWTLFWMSVFEKIKKSIKIAATAEVNSH